MNDKHLTVNTMYVHQRITTCFR